MRNRFTITISDVHGSKSYTFSQLIRKFFLLFILFILLLFASSSVAIWWLNKEKINIENKMVLAKLEQVEILEKNQDALFKLKDENNNIQSDLSSKLEQINFLDQTLKGLEELIDVEYNENLTVHDRIKLVQISTLGKKIMLKDIPSGRPVKTFKGVSSSYGQRTNPVTRKAEFHKGIDYRGKKGDGVITTANGVVEYAGFHTKSGYGNLIIVSHNYGFKTFYGHMSKLRVKTGQAVSKGQRIGDIGSTGMSSGNHLHYEVTFVQRKLDPTLFVGWNLTNYNQIFKIIKGVPWGSLSQKVQKRVQMVEKQLLLRDVK